jgi:hypothetical protein
MTITIPKISKTTLNGYLTVGISVCVALLSVPSIPQKYTVVIGTILSMLRLLTGHKQQDAGEQLAYVPGEPTPQVVPSHEVPDNPADKTVLPQPEK